MCLLNPWSVCNKAEFISDFIIDHNIHVDLLSLTETWLTGTISDDPVTKALLPEGYSILHNPRKRRGGGTAVVFRDTIKIRQVNNTAAYESFEVLECTIKSSVLIRLCVIYRPPTTPPNKFFYMEFAEYMSYIAAAPGKPLLVGDFNIHITKPSGKEFSSLCHSLDLKQHVNTATHRNGHILDLVLTRTDDDLVTSISSADHGFPDHYPVFSRLSLQKPKLPTQVVTNRKLKSITTNVLAEVISKSPLMFLHNTTSSSVDDLVTIYDTELRGVLNKLAPLKTRTITV